MLHILWLIMCITISNLSTNHVPLEKWHFKHLSFVTLLFKSLLEKARKMSMHQEREKEKKDVFN